MVTTRQGEAHDPFTTLKVGIPRLTAGDEAVAGCVTFGSQEGQGHVDTFDLAGPALGLGAGAAVEQVGFEFVEPYEHLRVDVQHRAADAGVFVPAGRAVRASAGAEFDLALIEALVELSPFLARAIPVFLDRPKLAALVKEGDVVADDVSSGRWCR